MSSAVFDPEAAVDPEDWYIIKSFVHEGITYGRNEPLPETITGYDIAGLMRIGVLARIRPDGSIERPSMPKPENAAAYLRQADSQVLRSIREHRPAPDVLLAIADLARRNRRSSMLIDALDAMAGVPAAPPRGVIVPGAGDMARLQEDLRSAVDNLENERREHTLLRRQHEFLQDEHDKLQQAHAELVEKSNTKSSG